MFHSVKQCFCWTKVHFVGPLIATILDFHVIPPMGFQSQGGSLTCILNYLHMVNLRVTSGATSAFSTNRGVHNISMYTAGSPSRHPSSKQQSASHSGLGSSGIQSCAASLTSEQAIHSAMPAGSCFFLFF